MDNSKPKAFIYMKIGPHGCETLPAILERKRGEWEATGKIFWSYGKRGPLHPTKQVQCFIKQWAKRPESIEVLMEPIEARSRFGAAAGTAKSYSARNNKEGCKDIPEGVLTGAPEHGLVLDEIRPCDLKLDLRDYEVGIGDNEGTNATQYLAFRGMKEQTGRPWGQSRGCLVKTRSRYGGPDAPKAEVLIKYRARLLCPNAVFTFPDKA